MAWPPLMPQWQAEVHTFLTNSQSRCTDSGANLDRGRATKGHLTNDGYLLRREPRPAVSHVVGPVKIL